MTIKYFINSKKNYSTILDALPTQTGDHLPHSELVHHVLSKIRVTGRTLTTHNNFKRVTVSEHNVCCVWAIAAVHLCSGMVDIVSYRETKAAGKDPRAHTGSYIWEHSAAKTRAGR